MTEYFGWWLTGGLVGIVAGLGVLRARDALSGRSLGIFPIVTLACLFGAKLQYLLRFHTSVDALRIAPIELLQPGYHIPLGLACAAAAGWIAAVLLRVPPYPLGDALAMAGAVMMPIGRIGCLRAGCCNGTVCPHWLDAMCMVDGRTPAEGGTGLLVHPLAVYFGLLGLGLALLQYRLLRRNAPPGVSFATALLLYPLGQLTIERLRDAPADHVAIMTGVLVGMIVIDSIVVGILWTSRALRSGSVAAAAEARG